MSARSLASCARRLRVFGGALLLAVSIAACGKISHPTNVDSEGVYVDAGPITYQVQLSRQLNPYDPGDAQLLAGVSGKGPTPSQMWFGIWMWAKNLTHTRAITTDSFNIVDTQGRTYWPTPVNRQINPLAWRPQSLAPGATEPTVGTAASYVPPQGGLVLFKLDNTVYSNRPLTLQIYAPGQAQPSTVSIDL